MTESIFTNRDQTTYLTTAVADHLTPTPAQQGVVNIDSLTDNAGIRIGDLVPHDGTISSEPIYTDDLTPTLSGRTENGGSLNFLIIINTEVVGSVTSNSQGYWSYTPDFPLEANQEYYLQTMVQDPGSNQFLISLPVHIVTTPPNGDLSAMVTIDSVIDDVVGYQGTTGELANHDATNDARPTLSGSATAGAVVSVYDNGHLLGSVTTSTNGKWTFTPGSDLSDGTHNLSASVSHLGETVSSESFWIDVDTTITKPFITSVVDDQGIKQSFVADGGKTDDSQPVLHGIAEANARVDIHVYGPAGNKLYYQSVQADAQGNWHYQPQAFTAYGQYSFGISAVDAVGNAYRLDGDKYTINYVAANQDDTSAPNAATNLYLSDDVGTVQGEIRNGTVTDDSKPTLSGYAEANGTVVISDNGVIIGSVTANSNGYWNFTPVTELADGQHSFTTVVRDQAGNQSPRTEAINFTLQTEIPTITHYDDLQDLPYDNIYRGDGFYIASNTQMGHSDGTSSSTSGLTILNQGSINNFMDIVFRQDVVNVEFRISGLQNDHGGSRIVIESSDGTVLYDNYVQAQAYSESVNFAFENHDLANISSVRVYSDNSGSGLVIDHLSYSQPVSTTTYSAVALFDNNEHDLSLSSLSAEQLSVLQTHALVDIHDGQQQTLNLTVNDILSNEQANKFIFDGHQQMAVAGDAGDKVVLHSDSAWNNDGMVLSGGVTYDVYHQSGSNLELLVQHGVELQYS